MLVPVQLPFGKTIYQTKDGTKIAARPSGTEPKIKFYFGVKAPLPGRTEFERANQILENKIERLQHDLGLMD